MSTSDRNDWDQKIKDLEQELFKTEAVPTPVRPLNTPTEDQLGIKRLMLWYHGLSQSAKVGVAVVAALVALSLLNVVLKLVASLIAIAILGAVLYGLYRAFVEPSSSDSNSQP
jgi:hypothetical protein